MHVAHVLTFTCIWLKYYTNGIMAFKSKCTEQAPRALIHLIFPYNLFLLQCRKIWQTGLKATLIISAEGEDTDVICPPESDAFWMKNGSTISEYGKLCNGKIPYSIQWPDLNCPILFINIIQMSSKSTLSVLNLGVLQDEEFSF